MEAVTDLTAHPSSAGAARRFVSDVLGEWDCAGAVEIAVLLTSELVTNAILHARSGIRLRVERLAHGVRVEVGDESPVPPLAQQFSPVAATGRGLNLVTALADGWGVDLGAPGKRVWFEVRSDG